MDEMSEGWCPQAPTLSDQTNHQQQLQPTSSLVNQNHQHHEPTELGWNNHDVVMMEGIVENGNNNESSPLMKQEIHNSTNHVSIKNSPCSPQGNYSNNGSPMEFMSSKVKPLKPVNTNRKNVKSVKTKRTKSVKNHRGHYECPLCYNVSTDRNSFDDHLKIHYNPNRLPDEPPVPETIESPVLNENEMKILIKKHEKAINYPVINNQGKVKLSTCKTCGKFTSVTKVEYWRHYKGHVDVGKRFSCPYCPFVSDLKHHYEYHMNKQLGIKPYSCTECDYQCVNKSMLSSHMKSHTDLRQFSCKDCLYVTKYCHSLKIHLRKYEHEPGPILNPDGTINQFSTVDVYGKRRGPKQRRQTIGESSNRVLHLASNSRQNRSLTNEVYRSSVPPPPPPPSIASPLNASASNAAPSNAAPSNAAPSNAAPSNASPTYASPTYASPSYASTSYALQSNVPSTYTSTPNPSTSHAGPSHAPALNEYQQPIMMNPIMNSLPGVNPFSTANLSSLFAMKYNNMLRNSFQTPDPYMINEQLRASIIAEFMTAANRIQQNEIQQELINYYYGASRINNQSPTVGEQDRFQEYYDQNVQSLQVLDLSTNNSSNEVEHPNINNNNNNNNNILKNNNIKNEDEEKEEAKRQINDRPIDEQPLNECEAAAVTPRTSGTSRRKGRAVKLNRRVVEQIDNSAENEASSPMTEEFGTSDSYGSSAEDRSPVNEHDSGNSRGNLPFECTYCEIIFGNEVMHAIHMGYHGYQNPFTCNMCGQANSDALSFNVHLSRARHS